MDVLGIIPARGGSKGIPQKNVALLAGKPLLAYTVEQALKAQRVTRLLISTDDAAMADWAKRAGIEVPFLRPAELAADETPMVEVVCHALRTLQEREGYRPALIVLLQPTSPLRRAEHIDAAIRLLEETNADTVVSVILVPHRFSPYAMMRLEGGTLRDFWTEPISFDRFRRQDTPALYARNGPAVLVSRASAVLARHSLYGERVVPYLMEEQDSVDIDTPADLQWAEWLLAREREQI